MTSSAGVVASLVCAISVAFSASAAAQGGVAALGQSVKRHDARGEKDLRQENNQYGVAQGITPAAK